MYAPTRRSQAIRGAALPKQLGLRRVQVLGHPVINHTPPEADDALLEVADRQDDPPAEAVVVAGCVAGLFAALIPGDDQAGGGKILDGPCLLAASAQRLQRSIPGLGCMADVEPLVRLRSAPLPLPRGVRRAAPPPL